MKLSIKDIAETLNLSPRGARKRAEREAWRYIEEAGRGGKKRLYELETLPVTVQRQILDSTQSCENLDSGKFHGAKAQMKDDIRLKIRTNSTAATLNQNELSDAATTRLEGRLSILRAWHAYRLSSGKSKHASSTLFAELYNTGQIDLPPGVLSAIPSVSGPSLLKWERQASKEGSIRLAGRYGTRKGCSIIDTQDALKDFIIGMLYTYPHADAKHVFNALSARYLHDKSVNLPSLRSVQRWVIQWKAKNQQLFTAVSNPDAWKNKYMVAHGSVSEGVERLNQLWELDGTPADLMLLDGRHVITGCLDVYSRRKRYLVTKTARATANVALLRRCLMDWGVPEKIKMDNGTDYKNYHLDRVLYDLSIEPDFCPPFSPWLKPHVERSFRTFSHSLIELMDGYIGHNVADRKAIEARRSFADRLFKKNEVVDIQLTAAQLQEFCDDWCERIYHHQPHEGLNGKSPFEMVSNFTGHINYIHNERALDLLLAEAPNNHGRRTIQKKGISIKWPGEATSHWYSAPEFGLHNTGQDVRVHYDPTDDMGRIYVFADIGFLCVAECPELLGISRKHHAQLAKQAQTKFIQDERRKLKAIAKKANVGSIAAEIRQHQISQTPNVTMMPKPGIEHTSDGLQAASNAMSDTEKASQQTPSLSQSEREKLAKDIAAQAEITNLPETPRQKYLRWCALDRAAQANKPLSDADHRFWKGYPETAEWKARQMIEEDFGLTDGHTQKPGA